ncbi:hypothetical protein LCGC14_0232580 [marine sediment metagenome]|uniref:Uncharacterized protein n=1 Tax=marine sediment metagenome TaxID=412755 RepID=A0A0F9URJ7_9ZZZZ
MSTSGKWWVVQWAQRQFCSITTKSQLQTKEGLKGPYKVLAKFATAKKAMAFGAAYDAF